MNRMHYVSIFIYQRQTKRRKKKLYFRGVLSKEKKEQVQIITLERYFFFFSAIIAVVLGAILQIVLIKQTPQFITILIAYIANTFVYIEQVAANTVAILMFIWKTWITTALFIAQSIIRLEAITQKSITTSVVIDIQTIAVIINGAIWTIVTITLFIAHILFAAVTTIITAILTIVLTLWHITISVLLTIKRNIDTAFAVIIAFLQPAIPILQYIIIGAWKSIVDLFTMIHQTYSALELQ